MQLSKIHATHATLTIQWQFMQLITTFWSDLHTQTSLLTFSIKSSLQLFLLSLSLSAIGDRPWPWRQRSREAACWAPRAILPHSLSSCWSTRMAAAGDRMSLCWNKFEETAASAFRYLGSSGDFSDVTLASEDGRQVKKKFFVVKSFSKYLLLVSF